MNRVPVLNSLRYKRIGIFFTLVVLITISLSGIALKGDAFLFSKTNTNNFQDIQISSTISNTTQWINNPSFDSSIEYWTPSFTGDSSDVNASINSGQANFEVLGEKRIFSFIADPPLAIDWKDMDNPALPDRPDNWAITSEGCRVSHLFDDVTAVQRPSIHWDHNISMPVDMSDYVIKSASVQAIINATVDENLDRLEDYLTGDLARTSPNWVVEAYSIGDFIQYYILVSDLKKSRVYEIAHFQTEQIGTGNPPGRDYLYDTYMLSVSEEDLIYALTSVLNTDNSNFTLTLGITLHIEDNVPDFWDLDYFEEIYIKYVNLTFTLEKKMDQYTSVSWNQRGKTISGDNVKITDVNLDFKYKVDNIWPESLQNSELKVIINYHEIDKKIKLTDFNTTFQEINLRTNYIKPYIFPNYNISISFVLFLGEEFELDKLFIFSIDDVYLTISYSIFIEDPFPFYIVWIILIISFIIIAILAILSLRSYIIMPRKLKRRIALLARTQKFKDVENIQGVLLIHSVSGLPLFSKNYSELMEHKNTLFSGFIQAVSLVSEEISNRKYTKSKSFQSDLIDGTHKVTELDFKHFFCLISDIEQLRTVLILKNKASKRLKTQMLNFGLSVYARFSEILKDWNHELYQFQEEIPLFLKNYFNLDYKEFFQLNIKRSDLERIKREFKLSREDYRTLIDILSISEENQIFKLITILKKLSHKSEDLIIDTIEVLIKNNLLIPADSSFVQV
ncbi:MAG: hypothetical protein ACFE75_10025 [Candidatus Hodarchaeota archaeon]